VNEYEPVTWQPLSALPLVSHLIDSALTDGAEHIETLTKASTKPHVLDDAIVDRIERVHREQLHFVELYAEQLRRWRTENPSIAQRQELSEAPQRARPSGNAQQPLAPVDGANSRPGGRTPQRHH
jgi:hypothetical protein